VKCEKGRWQAAAAGADLQGGAAGVCVWGGGAYMLSVMQGLIAVGNRSRWQLHVNADSTALTVLLNSFERVIHHTAAYC
jgi:hypothetical protein